jgi:hypothetical protein
MRSALKVKLLETARFARDSLKGHNTHGAWIELWKLKQLIENAEILEGKNDQR